MNTIIESIWFSLVIGIIMAAGGGWILYDKFKNPSNKTEPYNINNMSIIRGYSLIIFGVLMLVSVIKSWW